MEFILDEVGENFYEYNPTLSSFQDMNSSIELTLDIQIASALFSVNPPLLTADLSTAHWRCLESGVISCECDGPLSEG